MAPLQSLSPWPITCQNRTIVSSTPVLGSERPHQTSFSSLEPAQRRSCSWLPISAPFLAHAAVLLLHCSLFHLNKLPTHLTTQVPGSRRRLVLETSAQPYQIANGHLATPDSLQPLQAKRVSLTPPPNSVPRRHHRCHRLAAQPVRSRGISTRSSLGAHSLL